MAEKSKKRIMFLTAFAGMCEIFNRIPSEFLISVYYKLLSRYEADVIVDAISKASATLKFFPKPIELIELIDGVKPKIDDIALNQAMFVLKKIRSNGYLNKPTFDDLTTRYIMDSRFPWRSTCEILKESNGNWFIKEFVEAYRAVNSNKDTYITENIPDTIKKLISSNNTG